MANDTIDYEKEYLTLSDKYNELIYAVERKFDNESRHQTALRYIREMEKMANYLSPEKPAVWVEPKFERREWNVTPISPIKSTE